MLLRLRHRQRGGESIARHHAQCHDRASRMGHKNQRRKRQRQSQGRPTQQGREKQPTRWAGDFHSQGRTQKFQGTQQSEGKRRSKPSGWSIEGQATGSPPRVRAASRGRQAILWKAEHRESACALWEGTISLHTDAAVASDVWRIPRCVWPWAESCPSFSSSALLLSSSGAEHSEFVIVSGTSNAAIAVTHFASTNWFASTNRFPLSNWIASTNWIALSNEFTCAN